MRICVVGSVNLDIVATGDKLPRPGETVTNAVLARYPGGKGANQALAARRLGAEVTLLASVGRDANADEALALLRAEGVNLEHCVVDSLLPTGVALIAVAASGENQIVVAPGANRSLGAEWRLPDCDAVICQLEVPEPAIARAAAQCKGLLVLNLAPATELSWQLLQRADLLVVNETEAEFYGARLRGLPGLLAITTGSRGATLWQAGREIATARPPAITPVDTTGAGDAFVAALTVGLLERQAPAEALRFACAAGAACALVAGAQPALPTRAAVLALLAYAR
jgi:ribokinase